MEKFQTIRSIAVPWLMPNVDTDTISPMKRLILNMDQLDVYSFEPYRFVDGDGDAGVLNPDFPLNQPRFQGARILIAGENFGCGSSRETAPEAIAKCGYRCIISSGFGGIFTKNCYQQGILPIVFPGELVATLADQAEAGGIFQVDLENREVTAPDGAVHPFAIEDARREALLQGLDEVRRTLLRREAIDAFWAADRHRRPWLSPIAGE
jgi:3-isopropylmalate/(R)-2-methylmalate dehydratase small subunit